MARTLSPKIIVTASGITPPAWYSTPTLMVAGEIRNVGTNVMHDLQPTGQPYPISNVNIYAYCGGVFAKALGIHGSYLMYGGGHGDYYYNDAYRFDINTATWTRIVDPYLGMTVGTYSQTNGYWSDSNFAEWWDFQADPNGTIVKAGSVVGTHTYGRTFWAPQGSFGSDPAGYYCVAFAGNTNTTSPVMAYPQVHPPYLHYFALSPAKSAWQRHPVPFAFPSLSQAAYGPSLYDSKRNWAVSFNHVQSTASDNKIKWINLTDGSSNQALSVNSLGASTNFWSFEGNAFYDALHDLYIVTCFQNFSTQGHPSFTIAVIDPSTYNAAAGTMVVYLQTMDAATVPAAQKGGTEWVETSTKRRIVFYPGLGSNVVYWAEQPSDPRLGTWVWNTVTMTTGAAVAPQASRESVAHYGRFKYIPTLDAFFWGASANAQQVWKVW